MSLSSTADPNRNTRHPLLPPHPSARKRASSAVATSSYCADDAAAPDLTVGAAVTVGVGVGAAAGLLAEPLTSSEFSIEFSTEVSSES
jgi:hypothetical protein